MNPTANRPGLDVLEGRIGTHAAFMEAMTARLSSAPFPELKALATRDPSDPALALLDAWATVADVLAFYQERLANEGYLRTATERRSVLEIARLVGYAPRPGVAASAHLAYTIEADRSVTPPAPLKAEIPAGARAQSIPGPGELPQTYETSDPLSARTEWNHLQPRLTRPQTPESVAADGLYLQGTATNLKANDPLLIDFGADYGGLIPVRIIEVSADTAADRTRVTLRPWISTEQAVAAILAVVEKHLDPANVVSADTETAKDTVKILETLQSSMTAATTTAEQVPKILEKTLSDLGNVHEKAKAFTKLEPWLRTIIEDLTFALRDLLASGLEPAEGAGAVTGSAASKLRRLEFGRRATDETKPQTATEFFALLKSPPSVPPPSAAQLPRSRATALPAGGEIFPRLLSAFSPALANALAPALANANVTAVADLKVYAFRVIASLFGASTPPKVAVITKFEQQGDRGDRETISTTTTKPDPDGANPAFETDEKPNILHLDGNFDKIIPESLVIVETQSVGVTKESVRPFKVNAVRAGGTRVAYGISTKETEIEIGPIGTGASTWFDEKKRDEPKAFESIRQTLVFAQSELLPLAEVPILEPICDAEIELDGYYEGLDVGRWVIVAGERADALQVTGEPLEGIKAAELAMIVSIAHRVATRSATEPGALRNDKNHTFITLSTDPAYCYRRASVVIHGNVVKATHGETRREVLGSGDGAKALQTFELRQPPLTFVSAPDPSGIRSTLRVRVNEVEWHEADSLAGLGPRDRRFITQTGDDGKTKIVFGNGVSGARPPTGNANLRADYRNGIGKGGNVRAGQIALLASRPLGVKEVINPLRASGGADRETRDQSRRNAPLAVQALDRLVAAQDYADFARTFAGIGKASARRVTDGARQLVHLTFAGADDIPIDAHSDLYANLKAALGEFGDPFLPVQIAPRELLALLIEARVRVLPDYEWESVAPKVRAALLETFSFERRELGQGVAPGEVLAAIQRVRGVEYVDLEALRSLSEAEIETIVAASLDKDSKGPRTISPEAKVEVIRAALARANPHADIEPRILPAQLAFLLPTVPDTLLLTEISA